MTRARFLRNVSTEAALLLVGIPVLLWTMIPIYHMFLFAISPKDAAFSGQLWPAHPTTRNFEIVFGQQHHFLYNFWRQMWNSLAISCATAVLTLIIASAAAFASSASASPWAPATLTRTEMRGKLARKARRARSAGNTPRRRWSSADSGRPKVENVRETTTRPGSTPAATQGCTDSRYMGFISRGTPGSTTAWATRPSGPVTARRYPGAVPTGLSTTTAPSGMRACSRLFSAISRPRERKNWRMRSAWTGSMSRGTPATPAKVSLVRSSVVGPRPPVERTRSACCRALRQAQAQLNAQRVALAQAEREVKLLELAEDRARREEEVERGRREGRALDDRVASERSRT